MFGIFFHFIFESFSQLNVLHNGKSSTDSLSCKFPHFGFLALIGSMSFLCFIVELLHLNLISLKMLVYDATYGNLVLFSDRLKTALSKITQDCDQWIKPQTVSVSSSLPTSSGTTFTHMDVTPTSPPSHLPSSSLSLKVLHQTCHF